MSQKIVPASEPVQEKISIPEKVQEEVLLSIKKAIKESIKNKDSISKCVIDSLNHLKEVDMEQDGKDFLVSKIQTLYQKQIDENINEKYKNFKIGRFSDNNQLLEEYKKAYTQIDSINNYPLIWNELQIAEMNKMMLRSIDLMSNDERIKFYEIMDNLIYYHKYISYKLFRLDFIKVFGGKSYTNAPTTFESKSPFITNRGVYNATPTKIIFIFLTITKNVIKGGAVHFNKNNNELLKPPFLSNRWKGLYNNWNSFAHENLKRLFDETINLNFPEIVKYNKELKIDETIPYAYLLRLPKTINLSYMNIRWDFTGVKDGNRGGFYDGFYSFGKSYKAIYSIEIHEWSLFWALYYKYEEYIKQTFHHEMIHFFEDRYARIYDVIQENKVSPANLPLFKKAMKIWKVQPDSDDINYKITTKFNKEPKTLKEIYNLIVSVKKIKSMKQYLNLFSGHDYAFVKEVRNYPNCKEARIQRGKIEAIFDIMFYREMGEQMGKGRWIGCKDYEPETIGNLKAEKYT